MPRGVPANPPAGSTANTTTPSTPVLRTLYQMSPHGISRTSRTHAVGDCISECSRGDEQGMSGGWYVHSTAQTTRATSTKINSLEVRENDVEPSYMCTCWMRQMCPPFLGGWYICMLLDAMNRNRSMAAVLRLGCSAGRSIRSIHTVGGGQWVA